MKRTSAQAGEGKLESRFAALTSGLLARKGHAAPSNSPIADPAEETDAFALEPTYKTDKKRPAAAPAKTPPAPVKPAVKATVAPPKAPPAKVAVAAPSPAPVRKAEPAPSKKPASPVAGAPDKPSPAPMTVINERSDEAGYPDNPSPEEIAALEAEADEVVSYFENFGNEDAVAIEKDSFYGAVADSEEEDDDLDAFEALDGLDDLDEDDLAPEEAVAAAGVAPIAGPWAGASVPAVAAVAEPVRAGVTVQLTAREFMRLSLGAAELEQSAQQLIVEAIEEYLDARGVLSLGGCSCLEALTKKPEGPL